MANNITMLDVFRSMHSMNVEHVRQLFVNDFTQIINEKDEIIRSLQTQLCAINSSCDLKCRFCANLEQELQNSSKVYYHNINSLRMKANKDKECIDKLNERLEQFNSMSKWVKWARNQLNISKQQYEEIVEEKNKTEFDNKNLVESTEKNVKELETQKKELLFSNKNLEQSLLTCKEELAIKNAEIITQQSMADNDKQSIDRLNARIESLNGLLADGTNQLTCLRQQNDNIIAEKEKLEFDNKNLEQSLFTCGEQLKQMREEVDNRNHDKDYNRENLDNIDENEEQITSSNSINSSVSGCPFNYDSVNKTIEIENRDISLNEKTVEKNQQSVCQNTVEKQNRNKLFFLTLLLRLEEQDYNNFFAKPVNTDLVKDYLQIIKIPMDFSTIRVNIKNNKYLTFDAFEADFELIIKNCIYYNDKHTVYYNSAIKLREQTKHILKCARKMFELYHTNSENQMFESKQLTEDTLKESDGSHTNYAQILSNENPGTDSDEMAPHLNKKIKLTNTSLITTFPKSDALNAPNINLNEVIALQNINPLQLKLIIPETATIESLSSNILPENDECLVGEQTSSGKTFHTSDKYKLKHNDVVWAKCFGYPWYPAVIINPNISEMPANVEFIYNIILKDLLEKRPKHDNTYLVMFFDTIHSWQWIPRNKLYPLGNENIDNVKLVDSNKKKQRSAVRKAYKNALEFAETIRKSNESD